MERGEGGGEGKDIRERSKHGTRYWRDLEEGV